MEKGLKVLSVIGIFFCAILLMGNASNPNDFIYSVLVGFVWIPQSVLSLLLIRRFRKVRKFY